MGPVAGRYGSAAMEHEDLLKAIRESETRHAGLNDVSELRSEQLDALLEEAEKIGDPLERQRAKGSLLIQKQLELVDRNHRIQLDRTAALEAAVITLARRLAELERRMDGGV